MSEHQYAVIMAGGGGTRLWPVSRKEKPKQLLPLIGQETLFQSTVQRLEKLIPAKLSLNSNPVLTHLKEADTFCQNDQ